MGRITLKTDNKPLSIPKISQLQLPELSWLNIIILLAPFVSLDPLWASVLTSCFVIQFVVFENVTANFFRQNKLTYDSYKICFEGSKSFSRNHNTIQFMIGH